ncbi:MAG TPA: DUF3592 domain-containing protein [Anaerolineales bacterium]|jgi:hypothetical protein
MQTADEAFEPKKRKKSNSGGNWWWLIMLHSTWVILFGLGAWYGFTSWRFVSAGSEVPATVIALTENYSSDSGTTYSPVFEYRVNGQTYTYESVNTSDPPSHQVGDRATLLVDPSNPKRARENTFWELWLLPVIMCPVSLLVAVIAIVLTFVTKPWK